MLKITDYNQTDFTSGVSIDEAENVRITREINGAHTLDFIYPDNEKTNLIRENKIVVCDTQAYRIMRVSRIRDGRNIAEVHCSHVWNADAPNVHIQNMPDMIGVNPTAVIRASLIGSKFSLFTDSELSNLGLTRVDRDNFKIDFFSVDKTNIYDVMQTVIECCGKGEIYTDNYKVALVERIGKNTPIRLDITKNMRDMTVERDITDMVTRLYPYGPDDMHIGSVNGGVQYIESANASVYGVREGYRDYSDCSAAETLLSRAEWEFNQYNPERIDIPAVNITGTFADISRLPGYSGEQPLCIGDSVTVTDGKNEIYERVVKMEYYPLSNQSSVLSIGRVKKDMFFYLTQMGALARRYKKVSTSAGKVRASYVSGTLRNKGVISNNITADRIIIGTNIISTDENGTLLINGVPLTGDEENEQNI